MSASPTRNWWTFLWLVALTVGCGDSDPAAPEVPDEPVLGPTTVTIDAASIRTGPGHANTATVSLKNSGRAGEFMVEGWGLPQTPNGPNTLFATTGATPVAASWSQTLGLEMPVPSGQYLSIKWLIVFSRDNQNVVWRQTSEVGLLTC